MVSLVDSASGNTLIQGTHSHGQSDWMDRQRVLPLQQQTTLFPQACSDVNAQTKHD